MLEWKLEKFAKINCVYMRRVGAYGEENYQLMTQFKMWAEKAGRLNNNTVVYAVAQDNPEIVASENCRYDIGMLTEKTDRAKESLQIGTIFASGTYCVFTIQHTTDAVQTFWQNISLLMQQTGYFIDTALPVVERYKVALVEEGFCEICVPVVFPVNIEKINSN